MIEILWSMSKRPPERLQALFQVGKSLHLRSLLGLKADVASLMLIGSQFDLSKPFLIAADVVF